jgi:hypothetical protein
VGALGLRLLGGELAERPGDQLGTVQAEQLGDLGRVHRVGLSLGRDAVQHRLGGAQPRRHGELAGGDRRGIGRGGGGGVLGDPSAHDEEGDAVLGAEGDQLPEADLAGELAVAHVDDAAGLGAVAALELDRGPLACRGQGGVGLGERLGERDGGGVVVRLDHRGAVALVLEAAVLPHPEGHADGGEEQHDHETQQGVAGEQDPASGGTVGHP